MQKNTFKHIFILIILVNFSVVNSKDEVAIYGLKECYFGGDVLKIDISNNTNTSLNIYIDYFVQDQNDSLNWIPIIPKHEWSSLYFIKLKRSSKIKYTLSNKLTFYGSESQKSENHKLIFHFIFNRGSHKNYSREYLYSVKKKI